MDEVMKAHEPLHSAMESYRQRYLANEKRGQLFCDLVKDDASRIGTENLCILDIGCGNGFDNSEKYQEQIRSVTKNYCGVEPDPEIVIPEMFDEIHRCMFEDAEIQQDSIGLAYAVMVLEHVEHPEEFLQKVYDILMPGGVFWGFTVDARHPFAWGSTAMEVLKIKNRYLTALMGEPGEDRFINYPTHYRLNSPRSVRKHSTRFSHADIWSWLRVGENDYVVPKKLRFLSRIVDRMMLAAKLPGSTLLIRLEK